MYNSIVSFFQDGGAFMYPIMVVLAIGLAIALERYIYLTVSKANNRRMMSKMMPLLQRGDYKQVFAIASKSNHAVSRMLSMGLSRYKSASSRDDIETAMEESMMEVIPRLEKRTHYLATFANLATLLGLLGTIIGLIKAFTAVAQVDPAMKATILSTSISVAMNTTAFGLIVAIPSMIFYRHFRSQVDSLTMEMEQQAIKLVAIVHGQREG